MAGYQNNYTSAPPPQTHEFTAAMSSENLPFNIDAEQALLGVLATNPGALAQVSDKLSAEYFYVETHRKMYAVFSDLFITGTAYDLVVLEEMSVQRGVFDDLDAARSFVLRIAEMALTPSGVTQYAKIIEEKHMLRALCTACTEIYAKAVSGGQTPADVLDFAEQRIYDLRSNRDIKGLTHIRGPVTELYNNLAQLRANPDLLKDTSMSTSYGHLDSYIYGLNDTDLIIIAGRPGMGKTSFALNIAINTAKRYTQKKIAIFSFEMSSAQVVSRMLSSEAEVPSELMKSGQISDGLWSRLGETVVSLSQLEVYIDETPNVSIPEMKAKLRRMDNLGLVVIDYLQLMSTGNANRVNDVSEITRNLKIMAKELSVPVILLSQLSRSVEKRDDKRPQPSDLRDSGSIEQDADIVLFLYCEHHYNPEANPTQFECIIAKNRQGARGMVELRFDGKYTKFYGVDHVHADPATGTTAANVFNAAAVSAMPPPYADSYTPPPTDPAQRVQGGFDDPF